MPDLFAQAVGSKPDAVRYRSTVDKPGPISDFHRGCHPATPDGCPERVAFTCICGAVLHVDAYRTAAPPGNLDSDRHDDPR